MNQDSEHPLEKGFISRLLFNTFGRPRGFLGRLGGRLMARSNQEMAEWVIGQLAVKPDDAVIDIGFGPGTAIELLSHKAAKGNIVGVDYSEEMVKMASERNQTAITAGLVELQRGSVESLPFEDGRFDKALSTNSLQLWPDAMAGLNEIRRVLKPGGMLAIGFTDRARPRPSREEVRKMIALAGFKNAHVVGGAERVCFLAEA